MIKKIALVFCIVLLGGCVQQKNIEEAQLRENIGTLLAQYQSGVNSLNQNLLQEIISAQFSTRDLQRDEYIRQLLTMTLLIDKITYANIRIENYKVFADIAITGTQLLKPRLDIPLYREQLPFMNATTTINAVFCFVYEEEKLKLFAEEKQGVSTRAVWGEAVPGLTLEPLPASVKPGALVEIAGQITKGSGNDVVFVAINNMLVGSAAINGLQGEGFSGKVTIPATANGLTDISVMGFAGTLDLNNPQDAVLQGAQVIKYSIPVR